MPISAQVNQPTWTGLAATYSLPFARRGRSHSRITFEMVLPFIEAFFEPMIHVF